MARMALAADAARALLPNLHSFALPSLRKSRGLGQSPSIPFPPTDSAEQPENLTKPEFLGIVAQEKSYYSFDANGYHFVVLDSCFKSNGAPYGRKNFKWADAKLPPAELEWLSADLRQSPHKSIIFVHQCLDMVPPFGVRMAPRFRKILEDSGKVLAVLQGHFHWGNYQEIGDCTTAQCSAIIEGSGPENNAYAVMDILPGDIIRITGFRKQKITAGCTVVGSSS